MDILSILQFSGLKEPEAKVYLALLECGPATVLPIAKKAEVNRTYCYDILTSLVKQGLASYYEKNNRRRYSAQNPEHIQKILQERLGSFNLALPELMSIHNIKKSKPRVSFFEGKDGVWTVYKEMQKAKYIDSIYSPTHVCALFEKKDIEEHAKIIARKNIPCRDLYSGNGEAPPYTKFYGVKQEFAWLPTKIKLKTDLVLFNNKLVLISYEPEVHAIVIEGSSIVETQQQLFELLWEITQASKPKAPQEP